jgi:hypothetical protein
MPKSMPQIQDCSMNDCAYNQNDQCHTMAITIGDGACPMCDTYFKSSKKGGISDMTGGVGACKTANCKMNESLECSASGIRVGQHMTHGECQTFIAR